MRKFLSIGFAAGLLLAATTAPAIAYTKGAAPDVLSCTYSNSIAHFTWSANGGKPVAFEFTFAAALPVTGKVPGSAGHLRDAGIFLGTTAPTSVTLKSADGLTGWIACS